MKSINLAVRVSKITAEELKKALEKMLAELKEKSNEAVPEINTEQKLKHGKQTLNQLKKHNEGLTPIELTDPELRELNRIMKKEKIDFSVVKDGKGKYTLFFKGKDADIMTRAFKRYTGKVMHLAKIKSIGEELKAAKKASKAFDKGRDKEKNMDKGAR